MDFTDPSVVGQVNKWCSDNTHGKITEIVKSIPPETVMALVNALYFNGKWGGFKFDDKTKKEDFKTTDGSKTKVEMMSASSSFAYQQVSLKRFHSKFKLFVILLIFRAL